MLISLIRIYQRKAGIIHMRVNLNSVCSMDMIMPVDNLLYKLMHSCHISPLQVVQCVETVPGYVYVGLDSYKNAPNLSTGNVAHHFTISMEHVPPLSQNIAAVGTALG